MKKNYLFTLAALLLGSTIANAQKPLDGYEEPTFPKDGNVGNIVSFSTSGALEDLENISIPKTPNVNSTRTFGRSGGQSRIYDKNKHLVGSIRYLLRCQ